MNKNVVIIASGGRTGTRFFGDLLSEMVADSYSVHEPDAFQGLDAQTWRMLKTFGLYHMVIGRLLGRTGIRNLSQKYLSGRLDLDTLVRDIRRHRFGYYSALNPSLIIESYYNWYGILPVLPQVFSSYKVVGIVRDPRTWTASCMNFGTPYGPRDLITKFGFRRLDPQMISDRYFEEKWRSMSAFEKLCWTWKTVYGLISEFVDKDSNSKLYRYEDLFLAPRSGEQVRDMLDFLVDFPGRRYSYSFDPSILKNPVHAAGRASFPDWPEWDSTHARQLNEICGPLMKRFGYGNESAWHDLLRE